MEAFHLKRLTPVELLSSRKNRKAVMFIQQQQQQELKQQRGWVGSREIRAASMVCNKNLVNTTAAATITTTATTTETCTTAIERIKLLQNNTIASGSATSYSSPPTIYCSSTSSTSSFATGRTNPQPQLRPLLLLTSTPLKLSTLLSSASSSASNLHIRKNLWSNFYLRHDLTCIMMTMLFVISIVLSGNSALAAQRESFKPKDTNSLSNNNNNNANAIFNEIGGGDGGGSGVALVGGGASSLSGGSANGNAVSHSNVNNNISNGPNNIKSNSNNINTGISNTQKTTTSLTSTSTSTSTSSSSAGSSGQGQVGGGGYATTISSQPSSSSNSASISSSSSHKSLSSQRNSIELQENNQNGPYFDKAASKNVTALLGKTAYLNCRVKNLGNKTMLLQVSWVRHRDIHLLTVGRYTYTSDQRFRAIHQPQTEDWILQIKYPQHRDSGIYECQVSTTPHMSHYIHLNVVEPSTEIIGAPDLYIESGSTINLTCVILNSPEPPAYIFWNHNNAIINYDSPRGGVSVVTNKGETTTSFLLIKSARPSDSGHYQCNPSNAKPKSVTVHVLNGVSHSVSRGIPSSNAARGTSTSSNVSKSLYLSVPVNILIYLSICQALHKAIGCSAWSKICGHVIETCLQLLGFLLLTAMAGIVKLFQHQPEKILKCCIKNNKDVLTVTRQGSQKAAEERILKKVRNCDVATATSSCYYMQLRENYHMTRTALLHSTICGTATTTNNYNTLTKTTTAIVKSTTCKRQSLPASSLTSSVLQSTFSSSESSVLLFPTHIISCALLEIYCYLLYSKEYNLFKNATSATVNVKTTKTSPPPASTLKKSSRVSFSTTTSSPPLTILPCLIDNCSILTCYSCCFFHFALRCHVIFYRNFQLQSTATSEYFSDFDIR